MALSISYHVTVKTQASFGAAGWIRSDITTRSTRARDSIALMMLGWAYAGCYARAGSPPALGFLPLRYCQRNEKGIFCNKKLRYKNMKDSFAEVVEEVKNLSTEEKLELQILIEKYLVEEKRQEIYENHQASLTELKEDKLVFSSDVNVLKGMLND